TSLGGPAGPRGPLAVGSDGRIYLATHTVAGGFSAIYAGRLSASGTGLASAWTDVADGLWRNAMESPRELSVGPDGTVYASTSGGVFVLDGGAPAG
ncbi:MAG: hypothetical protein ACRDYV_03005, partial [Acidimicrobiia bacterium]